MAKARHNDFYESVFEILKNAKEQGVMLLPSQGEEFSGKSLFIHNQPVLNFGTCGYLGLETDKRLIEGAIDLVQKFGTQFSVSRAYLLSGKNEELETLLEEIFGRPAFVSSSTSLIHLGLIPLLIKDDDMVILDHQVHSSVQNPVQMLKGRGVPVEIIRHNNLEALEDKIKSNRDRYNKIWYAIDGVYSMFGDFSPIREIEYLLNKYPEFHLYVDDAHGMSWTGMHGRGYILSQMSFHEKLILVSTLGKGFGVTGGVAVLPSVQLADKLKLYSGAVTFSHPLAPPIIGASIASAKIHLSLEIELLQADLKDKISFASSLLHNTDLPVMSSGASPIFFIGIGLPSTGYKFIKRLLAEGFYANLAIFPAVPAKNTGLRFTITRHQTKEDIRKFIQAVQKNYEEVLLEENIPISRVRAAFKLPALPSDTPIQEPENKALKVFKYNSIEDIPKTAWNSLVGIKGSFDWEGLKFQEEVFSGNELEEYNWTFRYIIIKNADDLPVLATFYSTSLWKEDMLAASDISRQIEEKRKIDPYYLVSKAVTLGTFFSEGEHLYLNKRDPNWTEALDILIQCLEQEQLARKAEIIMIRDLFEDPEIKDFLLQKGYIKIDLPETCHYNNFTWTTVSEYIETLSTKSRKHFRQDILKFSEYFRVEIKNNLEAEEVEKVFQLHDNVKQRNFDLNIFPYPKKLFYQMAASDLWEFIFLYLKEEYSETVEQELVAVMFCYKSADQIYSPMIVGMDYRYVEKFNVYRQILFQTILRAKALSFNSVHFGITANFEKKKLGAEVLPKVGYIQTTDTFNLDLIHSLSVSSKGKS